MTRILERRSPYGVYDIAANAGCVSVGISNDTAQFAVNSIRCWLDTMGRERYPDMSRLMITADGGGSNGSRVRLFKIEHRLFCHITQTWRGKPLVSRETVVDLIASTTTRTGLIVRCKLDTSDYPKGIKVSDAEMDALKIEGDAFHPEWNYTISPRTPN